MTHTTNPLLSSTTITRATAQYQKARSVNAADSLFGVQNFRHVFIRAMVPQLIIIQILRLDTGLGAMRRTLAFISSIKPVLPQLKHALE